MKLSKKTKLLLAASILIAGMNVTYSATTTPPTRLYNLKPVTPTAKPPTTTKTGNSIPLIPATTTTKSVTTNSTTIAKPTQSTVGSTQEEDYAKFEDCVKTYPTSSKNLYYLTLAAISNSNYEIEEIQSTNGYILFKARTTTMLACISKANSNSSMIKLTPVTGSYNFNKEILTNIFEYITAHLNK